MAEHLASSSELSNLVPLDSVIIGAGISGLTAAYRLTRLGCSVKLLEASGKVGGNIKSHRRDGYLVEAGPNTFPNRGEAIQRLYRDVGLIPQMASNTAKNRYIYKNGQLLPIPHNPLEFFQTPLLSTGAKAYLLGEILRRPKKGIDSPLPHQDVSIGQFARYRLGEEVLENLLAPFLTGVYAGNPEVLSFPSVFPKLHEWISEEGSLSMALLRRLIDSKIVKPIRRQREAYRNNEPAITESPKEPYALLSFPDGLQELPLSIAHALPENCLSLNQEIQEVVWDPGERLYRVRVAVEGVESVYTARTILWAIPPHKMAGYCDAVMQEWGSSGFQSLCSAIPYVPLTVVHLGIGRERIPHPLDGFGFLVPRGQQLSILGSIWASSLFPERCPQGKTLFTCFVGGALHPELAQAPEEELIRLAMSDLATVFRAAMGEPEFVQIYRYPAAIPQYQLGHEQRVRDIVNRLEITLPGSFMTGNYLHGISLNDCILQAENTVRQIQRYLNGLIVS